MFEQPLMQHLSFAFQHCSMQGDASSVYWVHMFGRDTPENGMNRGDNRFRYVLR